MPTHVYTVGTLTIMHSPQCPLCALHTPSCAPVSFTLTTEHTLSHTCVLTPACCSALPPSRTACVCMLSVLWCLHCCHCGTLWHTHAVPLVHGVSLLSVTHLYTPVCTPLCMYNVTTSLPPVSWMHIFLQSLSCSSHQHSPSCTWCSSSLTCVCTHSSTHPWEFHWVLLSHTHTQHTHDIRVSSSTCLCLCMESVLPFPHREGFLPPLYDKAHLLFHHCSHRPWGSLSHMDISKQLVVFTNTAFLYTHRARITLHGTSVQSGAASAPGTSQFCFTLTSTGHLLPLTRASAVWSPSFTYCTICHTCKWWSHLVPDRYTNTWGL